MRSVEKEYELQALRRIQKLIEMEGARSVFTRGKNTDSNIDIRQIKTSEFKEMRDPGTGNYYFVEGYSKVGGPDVVRP